MKRFNAIGILLMALGGVLSGQSKEDLQQRKQKAFDEIKMARELVERTSEKKAVSIQRVRILQRGINTRVNLIETLENEISLIEVQIELVRRQVERLEKENKENKDEYARMVYYAFRNHTEYERLMYILAGESISQAYQRYKYLKYIGDYRRKMAEEIENMVDSLNTREAELNGLVDEKWEVLSQKESEQRELVSERARRNQMLEELKKRESELKKEIEEKERLARELESRIREIIEMEARQANADNIYAALTPEQELIGNDFRRNRGKLPWPVDKGIVTTGYGSHEVPGLVGSSVENTGIDIHSEPGTKVRAVFEGEVTKVFAILGMNYTVLVRHGEFLSVYQNLVNVRVKTGDKVLTKEILGDAYVDGDLDVATMHFEVWQERSTMNPQEWLSK